MAGRKAHAQIAVDVGDCRFTDADAYRDMLPFGYAHDEVCMRVEAGSRIADLDAIAAATVVRVAIVIALVEGAVVVDPERRLRAAVHGAVHDAV